MIFRSRLLLTVISAICLCPSAFAQQQLSSSGMTPDESALRALVVKYFDTYTKKDIDAVMALWSKSAPDISSRREFLLRMFPNEDYQFSEPSISLIKIEGDHASAQLSIARVITRIRNSSTMSVRSVRSGLSFVRENGEWKLFSETPATVSLSNALIAAKTGSEREALMADNQDLVNRELLGLLISQSEKAYTEADYPHALSILICQRLVAERLMAKEEVSQTWMREGEIHFAQKRYQQALESYQKGLAIEEEIARKSEQAHYLTAIGDTLAALSKPQEAIETLQRGLAIYEERKEKEGIAETLDKIGDVHHDQGDYERALEFYQQSLKWIEAQNDYAGRLIKIARTEYEEGNDDAAISFYSEAASRLESSGFKRSIGYVMHSVANIYYSQGDYAQAMNYYNRCLAAEKEFGSPQGVAGALQGIGLIHSLDGNYALALEAYQENLKVVQALPDKSNIATAWQKVGGSYFSLRQFDQALDAFKQALALREQEHDIGETANALIDLGVTYGAKSDFDAALDIYQRARTLLGETNGAVVFKSPDYALAFATVLLNESMIRYAREDYAKTITEAKAASVIAKQFGDSDLFWESRYREGKAQYRLEKLDLARQAFVEAITTIETLRPRQRHGHEPRFYENKLSPYLAMVDVAVSEGKGNEAFEYAERAKARTLLGVVRSASVWITKKMTPQEREREKNFLSDISIFSARIDREMTRQNPNKSRLEDLTGKLSVAQTGYAEFRDRLYARLPRLKTMRGEGKPLDAARVAALLGDSGTALLDFVETEEYIYLFTFTKESARAGSQPSSPLKIYIVGSNSQDLAARVSEFQELISHRDNNVTVKARELYDLLIKPAEAQIGSRKHLIIAPDAVSWNLPFHALVAEDGRYLIEEHAISYIPSLTALGAISTLRARPRSPRGMSPSLLAVMTPALSPPLETRVNSILPPENSDQTSNTQHDAQNEVDELIKLYGERRVSAIVGPSASEGRVKAEAGKYDLLQMDVRCVLNETAPLFSFAALSSEMGSKEDGALEVRELFDLNLKSELAMITTSELAWPKSGAMRSMTGLTWGWFVAGCPAVVVSRWRSDESVDLALEINRRVKSSWAAVHRASKAEIWQAAVKEALSHEDLRQPYFWAGFSILGDAR